MCSERVILVCERTKHITKCGGGGGVGLEVGEGGCAGTHYIIMGRGMPTKGSYFQSD